MVSALTLNSFFSKYISDPFSNELSNKDKLIALVASLVLSVCTLSLIYPIASFIRNRSIKPLDQNSPAALTAEKVANERAIIALQHAITNKRDVRMIADVLDEKTRAQVTELDLKDIEGAEIHLDELGRLFPNTKTLLLTNKKLHECNLNDLPHFQALHTLGLSSANASISLEDTHIGCLKDLSSLRVLDLSGNQALTGTTFAKLPQNLEKLILVNCTGLKADALDATLKRFGALIKLAL